MQEVDIIYNHFPQLSEKQREQFAGLKSVYQDWNEKINVISRKDIDNLYVNHVLHSLGIAKVVSFNSDAQILDVGTGGGFPGIPLAILFPQAKFHLVDSIGKKITVVENVCSAVGLTNVRAEKARAEEIKSSYDFIVSRAVTRMSEFYGWVNRTIKPKSSHKVDNGILYLKGGDVEEEMEELKKPYAIYELKDYFEHEFFETKKLIYIPKD